jgi:hypothetical protein
MNVWLAISLYWHIWAFGNAFPNVDISAINVQLVDQRQLSFLENQGRYSHAICYHMVRPKRIVVNRQWWAQASYRERRKVVFHEFGHCALNLRHTFNYPNIMDIQLSTAYLNWDTLMQDLKQQYKEKRHGLR